MVIMKAYILLNIKLTVFIILSFLFQGKVAVKHFLCYYHKTLTY